MGGKGKGKDKDRDKGKGKDMDKDKTQKYFDGKWVVRPTRPSRSQCMFKQKYEDGKKTPKDGKGEPIGSVEDSYAVDDGPVDPWIFAVEPFEIDGVEGAPC